MAAGVPTAGAAGALGPTAPRRQAAVERGAEGGIGGHAGPAAAGLRAGPPPLDHAADCAADPRTLRRPLPPRLRGHAAARPGPVVPEAGAAGAGARRGPHRRVAARAGAGAFKKRADGVTVVFADEAGFLMNPCVKRTWAKTGHTPVVLYRNRHHKKVSVLGAIAARPDGTLTVFTDWYPGCYVRAAEALAFVGRLLQEIPGPIALVWDNLSAHKGPALRQLLAHHPRLSIHYLPPYAPDLNPV